MTISRVLIHSYAWPLRPAWPSAEGPVNERHGSIFILEDPDGAVGLGETAPWPGFGLETHASSVAALRGAAKRLIGLPNEAYMEVVADLPRLAPVAASPCARHAIDLALHDLAAQRAGLPIARFLGGAVAVAEVPVNCAIPRLPAREAALAAGKAIAAGFETIKLKVGGAPLAEDVERLRAVREAVGPGARIRIDANQAWSESEAMEALATLRPFALEYCEQPVAADAIAAMARVRAACGVPIAADESVRDASTVKRITEAGAADIVIIKPMALGGLHAARSIAMLALDSGLHVVVTSLLESAVGQTGALHLAASLGVTSYAHGLGTAPGSEGQPHTTLEVVAGRMRVPSAPGLGANVDGAFRESARLVASGEGMDG